MAAAMPVDHALLHALNGFLVHHDAVEDPLTVYVNAAEGLFAALLVTLFVLGAASGARRAAVAAGLATALALGIGQVISRLVDRPRPFVSDPGGVRLFSHHAADPGFPSDHATAAFAIAVSVLLWRRRPGLALVALAAVLCVGRVAIGVHYPTDVVAGAAIGTLCALALDTPPARRAVDRLVALTPRVSVRRTTPPASGDSSPAPGSPDPARSPSPAARSSSRA
ncbi:MAG: hypothetical protein QOJ82_3271 [Solirubrobacteraceae bacterium]|jgi:undecaprenyl-diphosphatase|nr:hypothetical protein [Solirubrobacteraceae bacterium]